MRADPESDLRELVPAPILHRSGFELVGHCGIEVLREGRFRRDEVAMVGEAPKDFLRVYEYGAGHKARPGTWPAYIAKVGQKRYPNESVTEHLLTRLGQGLGVGMAESRLMWVRGQLRFLSRYFLRPDESLVHGAEIFAGHLADLEFVQEVERQGATREVFTFQVVEESVRSRFPDHAEAIMADFVRLLGFDALVGNNDRHYYNWGVITQVRGRRPPQFSPIYDTARALLWNEREEKLARVMAEGRAEAFVDKYVSGCVPKTGWDGCGEINHFDLMTKLARDRPRFLPVLQSLAGRDLGAMTEALLRGEFDRLYSAQRKKMMVMCAMKRLERFRAAIG